MDTEGRLRPSNFLNKLIQREGGLSLVCAPVIQTHTNGLNSTQNMLVGTEEGQSVAKVHSPLAVPGHILSRCDILYGTSAKADLPRTGRGTKQACLGNTS